MIKTFIEQNSEEWYQIRLGKVTGTRFSKLMMGKSTKGYQDLILDLQGEIITQEIEETYSNDAMQRGKELEPEARKAYSELKETEVEEIGFIEPDEDNEFYGFIGISPDGLIPGGMIEIKCPNRNTHLRYLDAGILPSEYKHQVQGQLFTTKLPFCDFFSYYPNLKPFLIRIYPDLEQHAIYEKELRILSKEIEKRLENYYKK